MNIVLIEDEPLAAQKMMKLVKELLPAAQVVAQHDTVRGAAEWFAAHEAPDLVLLDVQLSDGTAFDLLKDTDINCPVIFTTAYDQYAINAFQARSIDYLLKPVKKGDLDNALKKLKRFEGIFAPEADMKKAMPAEYKKRFMIRFGEHIKSVAVEEIAYCYSENKNTYARLNDGRTYPLDHNLDALETMLDPVEFFRINRQYIITIRSIAEMKTYSKARVIIKLVPAVKDQPVVSSERAAEFKKWLAGEV
jgi:DNA-binding LytR/AlgR family response regulator